jgi:predicted  nucleic acid-binding Zn-ribbon protein
MAKGLIMGDGPVWAVVGAMIAGVFTIAVQKLRGQTTETVAVMEQWKDLLDAHKQTSEAEIRALKERLSALEKELADVRDQASKDMAELRRKHADEIDEMRKKHRDEMRTMRELNDGLQRMIAQNSQSTAQLIGDTPVSDPLKRSFPAIPSEEE